MIAAGTGLWGQAMRLWWMGLLALCAAGALASGREKALSQVEGSLLVTGHVLIETDGSVSGWEVDQREKLPPAVTRLIESSASSWVFEPVVVGGQPRKAKARMGLRVVVRAAGEAGMYRIAIAGAHFGDDAITGAETDARDDLIRKDGRLKPPRYPEAAQNMGARGTVYLVLQVGRDGKVADAFAERVDLKAYASDARMRQMRDLLSKSALLAAKDWTFRPPTSGEDADAAHWYVRVPVDYLRYDEKPPEYGEWNAYMPGPRHVAPWAELRALEGVDVALDALETGGIYPVGKGLKLLTPLQPG